MKRLLIVILICFSLVACTSKGPDDEIFQNDSLQEELKAADDREFDQGSNIDSIILTEEKIEDLFILGKVWGFLKYYHPAIAEGKYNWDYQLFRVLPKVLESKTSTQRDEILLEWINSLGSFSIKENGKVIAEETKLIPNLQWIDNSKFSGDLEVKLNEIKNAVRTNNHYYIGLKPQVGNPEFKNEDPYTNMKYPDAGFQLLSLYRYWNIIEYYFPYKNLIEEDWDEVLMEFIPKFVDASKEVEYKLAALELIGRIHDTHANIWNYHDVLTKHWGQEFAPIGVTFIEEKLVITDFLTQQIGQEAGLKVGDVIISINNKPVEDIVAERLKYTPASNYPTKLRNIAYDILRSNESHIDIEVLRDGKIYEAQIKANLTQRMGRKYEIQDTYFKILKDDIAYINIGLLEKQYVDDIMLNIKDTKGLIIDIRNYPKDFPIFELGKHLVPNPIEFVKFTNGSIIEPGLFTFTKPLLVGNKNPDYYKGKVVILVNEITQSSAEYHAMAFSTAPNAVVIGSTTSAADGNISPFHLPGDIYTLISGIGVYYPDGSETQRVGIKVDIEVKPTIEGIKQNRDEVLEKAFEIINN